MTGTNSSNDRLILRRNVEINSNWYFSYDVFSGIKSSTTWNGNAIAQSPRKMSEFRGVSNTSDIRFLMVYWTIIDVILHLFIICYDLWCQLPFFHKLSVITEALFSVRCLRCVVVARMCGKTCLATVLIRSIFAREKLHERFSASAVFRRKIERINTATRHVLL